MASRTASPTGESMKNAQPLFNPRVEAMVEASRMIQAARAVSPVSERASIVSQQRSGTISPSSGYQKTQTRSGTISPVGKILGTQQRPATASSVTAYPKTQPLSDKNASGDTSVMTVPQLDQKAADSPLPTSTTRPATSHIASSMKPLPEKTLKEDTPLKLIPRLEKLANTHEHRKLGSHSRSNTPVGSISDLIPYPERVLMGTSCLRIDMPPGEDSDDDGKLPTDARKEKFALAMAGPASPKKPPLKKLPSLSFSTHSTQKKSWSDMLPPTDNSLTPTPQKTLGSSKSVPKILDTKLKSEKKHIKNLTSETIRSQRKSFRSSPKLKVNTPLANFSGTMTDTEKALPAEPGAIDSDPTGPPGGFLSSRMSQPRQIAFIFLVCMLQIIPQAALTICFPISSIIAGAFKIRDPSVLPWMVAAYATTFGTFILVSGRLGDILGHKKLVIVGFILMTPWSVLVGISHMVSPILFFVARAMQGVAASLIVPNGLALLGMTFAPGSKMKIIAFSLFGLCAPLGAYLGMLLAAIFAQFAGFPYVFFLLAGLSLLSAIASRVVLVAPPPTAAQMRPIKEKLGDMDWLGAFTGVVGLICVQVAVVSAPSVGWGTSWIFMLLIIGLLLVAAFVVVEIKVAENPLIPFPMLRRDVAIVLAAVACGWAVFGIWLWYLWRYLLTIRHYTPLESALHVLPVVPVALLASILTAYLMRTTKPAYILLYATLAATLSPLLLYFAEPTQTYWGCIFISLLLMPIFMDFCLPAATYIMSNYFPAHMQGASASLIATVMYSSISLGIGLATTTDAHTSVGRNPILSGIRGAWLTASGIGAFGVLLCAIYLFKTILNHQSPTIRDLDVASMMQLDVDGEPDYIPTPNKPPRSLRTKSSFGAGRVSRHPSSATNRLRFSTLGFAASFSRTRKTSTSSVDSSLFPLTRGSSTKTTTTNKQKERETLTTALPAWRDRMMPQYEWRQVPVQGDGVAGAGGNRFQQAQRVHLSQQERYLQGRRGGGV